MVRVKFQNELYHHGIKGQKWGVRRYQNEDGTLTPAGKERYGADHVITKENWDSEKSQEYLNKMSKGDRRRAEHNVKKSLGNRAMTVKYNGSTGKHKISTSIVGTSEASQKKINRENGKRAAMAITAAALFGIGVSLPQRIKNAKQFKSAVDSMKNEWAESERRHEEFARQAQEDWERDRRRMYGYDDIID